MMRLALLMCVVMCGCVTPGSAEAVLTPREQAQRLLQKGDAPAAVAMLQKLHAENPKDLTIARALAEAHVKAGDADAFLTSIAARQDAVSYYMRALVLYSRAADASGPAVEAFKKAAELAPQEAEFRYRLGLALVESEKYEPGLVELQAALQLSPGHVAWKLPLAKALVHTGAQPQAIEAIRDVVMHSTSVADVKTAKAVMDQIADPFSRFPASAKPGLDQAMQWLYTSDVPQQAILELENILRDFPDIAVVHALLGLASARIDDAGRAVEELKRAIELDPTDGKSHLYLAEFYGNRQRTAQAREHYEKAVLLNPTLGDAWSRLGDMAVDRQDLPKARENYAIAARLSPDDMGAHGKVAAVYQLEGDWAAADKELRLVIDREPENMEFMLRLGLLHTEKFTHMKQSDERKATAAEAEKWLTKVLDEQPENAMASRALERVKGP